MTAVEALQIPGLLAEPRARHNDPQTSKAAARRMREATPNLHHQILDVLGRYSALTKDEVGVALAIDPRRWPSVASALSQLKRSGMLVWTGETRAGQNLWRLRDSVVHVQGERL